MKWFNSILNVGVTAEMSRNNRLCLQTVNGLAEFLVVALCGTTIVDGVSGNLDMSYGIPILGSVAVLGLNHVRQYYFAALLTVLVTVGSTILLATSMDNPEWYLCLLPAMVFPQFLFSVEDKRTARVSSGAILLLFTAFQFRYQSAPWIEVGVALGILTFTLLSKKANQQVELALLEERAMSDQLLHNFLPEKIAKILRASGGKPPMIAQRYENVCVIFSDIVNFTPMSEKLTPEQLVAVLNQLFTEFDKLIELYGLEKIKTIGDAYMVAGGVPEKMENAPQAAANFALDMLKVVKKMDRQWQHGLDMRIGMHIGPVVAGVIGRNKFAFDMWGDTVNVSARMESHGLPGEIQITEAMADLLKDEYLIVQRGWVEVKGKGLLQTFWLKGRESKDVSNESTVVFERPKKQVSTMSSPAPSIPTPSSSTPRVPQGPKPKKKKATWATKKKPAQTPSTSRPTNVHLEETLLDSSKAKPKKGFWEK
jgi:class 3 adenylate cyclase